MLKDPRTGETVGPMTAGEVRNLKTRVVSGAILIAVALGATLAGGALFAAFVAAIGLVMSWEWGKLVRSRPGDLSFALHGLAIAVAVTLAAAGWSAAAAGAVFAGAGALVVLNIGRGARLSGGGVLYVGLPAVACILLRSSEGHGLVAVLFVLASVWAADTAAFAGGRMVGGAKLWPSISPNKTWAGLISAVVASALVGLAAGPVLGVGVSVYLIGCAAGLGAVSQAGDLAESALKRLFKVKDASNLIPGHGGFLDRMDGIVAAVLVGVLLGLLLDPNDPARGLMLGLASGA
ncbi:MAG: phosphatidate cytidylyltransferase [Hyphomicrobiaceae bacterium]|nr:phosphatidate cytidylyltransferase [Hyphomicrobiaceae bacterium]